MEIKLNCDCCGQRVNKRYGRFSGKMILYDQYDKPVYDQSLGDQYGDFKLNSHKNRMFNCFFNVYEIEHFDNYSDETKEEIKKECPEWYRKIIDYLMEECHAGLPGTYPGDHLDNEYGERTWINRCRIIRYPFERLFPINDVKLNTVIDIRREGSDYYIDNYKGEIVPLSWLITDVYNYIKKKGIKRYYGARDKIWVDSFKLKNVRCDLGIIKSTIPVDIIESVECTDECIAGEAKYCLKKEVDNG